jgi:hypothetical protein
MKLWNSAHVLFYLVLGSSIERFENVSFDFNIGIGIGYQQSHCLCLNQEIDGPRATTNISFVL